VLHLKNVNRDCEDRHTGRKIQNGVENLCFRILLIIILRIFSKDDLNGSVGSIADLKPKGPGFESRISQGFFLM
jgi:hypothetical protein